MTSILDRFLDAQRPFNASTPQEFLALQIARKLSDMEHVKEYATLLEHFEQDKIIRAFQKARAHGRLHRDEFLSAFRKLATQPDEYEIGGD
jgi:hypothetical protein